MSEMQHDAEFDAWMKEVDNFVQRNAGVSVHDLADYCFRDSFDAGLDPQECAEDILEDEGF